MTTKASQPFETTNQPNVTNRMRPRGDAVRLRNFTCCCGPWFPFGSECVQAKLGVPVAGSCIRTNMRSLSGCVQLCASSPLGWRNSQLYANADESAFLLSVSIPPASPARDSRMYSWFNVCTRATCVRFFVRFFFIFQPASNFLCSRVRHARWYSEKFRG